MEAPEAGEVYVFIGPSLPGFDAAAHGLELLARVADDQRARGGAADDQHLVRDRLEHGAERTAGDGETAKHHAEKDNQADTREHAIPRRQLMSKVAG